MIAEEFENEHRALPWVLDIKDKKLREAQRASNAVKENEIRESFKDALKQEYGQSLTEAGHEFLWNKAWEDGHSAGYFEVESQYENQLRFFEQMTEANNQ